MKEFLRKNAKLIMTVLSIGLMMVFALPTFRNKTEADYQGQTVGTLAGRKVTQGEMTQYTSEFTTLKQLGVLSRFELTAQVLQIADEDNQPALYYMLCQEAAKYTHTYINFNEALDVAGVDEIYVTRNLQMGQEQFTGIISRLETVDNFIHMVVDMPEPVSQVELMGDRDLRKVQVTLAETDGAAGWQSAAAPTEDQIKAQFDAYKSVVATPAPRNPRRLNDGQVIVTITYGDDTPHVRVQVWGEDKPRYDAAWDDVHRAETSLPQEIVARVDALAGPVPLPKEVNGHFYPFGYRIPDRAQVEWLALNRAEIRKRMIATVDDVGHAYDFFKLHPDKVKDLPAATAPATTPATASAPATKPDERTWEDVKQQLIDQQLDARVNDKMKKMLDQISTRTQAPWKSGTPAQEAWVNYADLAKEVSTSPEFMATPDFKGYTPEYHTADRVMTEQELGELPGIGDAVAAQAQRVIPFHYLAVRVKELVAPDKNDPASRLGLTVGADGPVVKDADGNAYIYRVTRAEPAHDPATLDDVIRLGVTARAQAIEDLKKVVTYEASEKAFNALVEKSADLSAVADQYKAHIQAPDAFSRSQAASGDLPLEIAGIRGFADKAFTLKEPTPPAAPAMATVDSEETLQLSAMRLVKYIPASPLDFSRRRVQLADYSAAYYGEPEVAAPDPAVAVMARQYFDVQTIADRIKYVPVNPFKKKS